MEKQITNLAVVRMTSDQPHPYTWEGRGTSCIPAVVRGPIIKNNTGIIDQLITTDILL